MARLNESTAPSESIDSLKRRFVRQNREIARVNSIQSLRIRGLESEVSHLLSENVSLREQVITLSQDIARFEAAKMLHEGVYDLKAKLESKLTELGNLVTDLEQSRQARGLQGYQIWISDAERQVSITALYQKTEDSQSYSKTSVIQEGLWSKPQELQDLLNDSLDDPVSPGMEDEVPVLQLSFEDDNHGSKQCENTTEMQTIVADSEDGVPLLPPTLETRKKKKSSLSARAEGIPDMNAEYPIAHNDSKRPLKSGSKRKFISEDDQLASIATGDDDFQFSRPSIVSPNPDEKFVSMREDISPVKRQVEVKRGPRNRLSSKRKVFEPKSTNINMSSPKKFRALMSQGHDTNALHMLEAQGDENKKSFLRFQEDKAKTEPNGPDHAPTCYFDSGIEQENEGPGHVIEQSEPDMTNPPSPEMHLFQQDDPGRTPDMLNAPSRVTRRQRAVVSYAEPNLRDKMRRPTKELIDAVGYGGSRRSSSSQVLQANSCDENEKVKNGLVSIKSSRVSDVTDSDSGRISKEVLENSSKQPMDMVSQRKRKTLPANKGDTFNDQASAQSVAETKTFISGQHDDVPSHGYEADSNNVTGLENESAGARRDLQSAVSQELTAKTKKTASRQSRRHSSNPRHLGKETPLQNDGELDIGAYPVLAKAHSGSSASSKPVHGSTKLEDTHDSCEEQEEEDSRQSLAIDSRQVRRGQRVAARRRSMVL
ncbi:hypothetical protein MW887_001710 [Aspergillus wentii]|nr:hypothetical protein MW887_001710 [Aspergillus wentii]